MFHTCFEKKDVKDMNAIGGQQIVGTYAQQEDVATTATQGIAIGILLPDQGAENHQRKLCNQCRAITQEICCEPRARSLLVAVVISSLAVLGLIGFAIYEVSI